MNETGFVLPTNLITKADVARIVNEFEQVDNSLTTVEVRADVGVETHEAPVVSEALTRFLEQNNIDLRDAKARAELVKQLHHFKENLPVLHMTFAVEADAESLEKLAEWARNSVDPHVVLDIGLQPSLIAGVYLRTPNHVHDMSVRGVLSGRRGLLVKELETLRAGR